MFQMAKRAVKEAWQKGKQAIITSSLAVGALVAGISPASANTTPTIDTSQVTSTFSTMSTTVITVIGAVAAVAVTIMGIILAWKYVRKLFNMLAK